MDKVRTPKNIFVQGAISPEKIATSIANHSTKTEIGGHSIFLGQVRADQKQKGEVVAIEYTAYEEMALQKAFEIREAVFAKYPLTCMHIYHSLGEVKVGEICLFVFTVSWLSALKLNCRFGEKKFWILKSMFGKRIVK